MKTPVVFLMHPLGDGPTRTMNVLSSKLWLRALIDALPDVSIAAPALAYAEVMVARERGLRDSMAMLERCHAVVAVGGEFSRGMRAEWSRAEALGLTRYDLTRPPMPGILSYETFIETRTAAFHAAVVAMFQSAAIRAA